MKILVTGASGLLGLNFGLHYTDRHQILGIVNTHPLQQVPFEVKNVDLEDFSVLQPLIEKFEPDLILHCAAMANVDQCEKFPDLAYKINAEMPGELAALSYRHGIRMVHFSTDAVFDGIKGNYVEDDETNPINMYARTKLAGEHQVAKANPDCLIARVNFYGWSLSGKRSLAELFYYQLSAGKGMMGFTDVFFCPLHVLEMTDLIMKMVDQDLKGLYHVVSGECLSKYEFGRRIARKFGLKENKIKPTSWRDAGLVASRSPNLTLNISKLRRDLSVVVPDQETSLQHFFELEQEGYPQRLQSFSL